MTKQVQEKYACSDLSTFNILKGFKYRKGYINRTSLVSLLAAALLVVLSQCGLELPAADLAPEGRAPRSAIRVEHENAFAEERVSLLETSPTHALAPAL